ncbi:MAG: diguanylate cyclase [Erythrobacter sp.]|uniref:sensor domain-containing diguanylate cyclase n=1 Tax=Erythrobacter sp. TaxID=1042 RepID=UPI00262B23F2|nr:diguanylate cyclase [Erythrobacter sp.]MDJ0978261.1 diguanylate cyclase [Erythrobacter sp.]
MGWVRICARCLAIVLALAVLAGVPLPTAGPASTLSPAFAHVNASDEPSFAPRCHAASGLGTRFADMAARRGQSVVQNGADGWTCSNAYWVAHEPVAWLLFERESWQGQQPPRFFFSRIARHKSISFAALDRDGTLRTETWTESEGQPFAAGPVFQLPLPGITDTTDALLVRIERPHSVPLLTEARLSHYPEDADWSLFEVLTLAFVMGMLVLPLFFDLSFFIVLRERFVLLHAAMVIAMMAYVLFAGGLASAFAAFSVTTIAVGGPLFWAIGVGISALFLAEFLEHRAQSRFMRRLTIAAGLWSIAVPGFFALQFHATQSFDDRGYFYAFMPVIVIISAAVAEAVARGSRSARFIAVAWTPIILASIERLLRGIGFYVGPSSADLAIFVATGLEVIVISLAIADRFLAIRRERDAALTEAQTLAQLSSRDPLTGLLNRRGLEARFAELFAAGFDTFALIDLDRFKQINDCYGHQIGDAALVACAQALRARPDPDLVAARLGGEEFVVLLRGERTLERAEALRKAIPMRIAAEVEGLDGPVTASSGAIEVPAASSTVMSFEEFYARADALMYDAKASGRNRMLSERLTVFDQAPPARPADDRHRRARDEAGGEAGSAEEASRVA